MGLCRCMEPGESILKDLLVFFGLHLVGKTIVATCDKGKGPQRNFYSGTARLSALPLEGPRNRNAVRKSKPEMPERKLLGS